MLIVFCGLPGSGKSYLASLLAAELKLDYLNTDILREKKSSEITYSHSNKFLVYENMLAFTIQLLSQGKDVIVDGTFYKKSLRDMFKNKAQNIGHLTKFIYVFADEETIKQRIVTKRKYSDADFEVYQKIKKSFDYLKCNHLSIDTGTEYESDSIKKIITFIH